MTRHFYAVDHANDAQTISAFTVKEARDNFVEGGTSRFSKTAKEADEMCQMEFECTATQAVARGFI